MPRTRKKIEQAASDDMFDPTAVASAKDNPEFEEDERRAYPEDEDGELPADHDDGSGEGPEDDDPSDVNALGRTTAGMTQGQQAAAAELKDYMRRMSNLAEERAAVAGDIRELKKEIKGKGYDLKAFDLILKISEMDEGQQAKRREQNGINATYAHAVGIKDDLL